MLSSLASATEIYVRSLSTFISNFVASDLRASALFLNSLISFSRTSILARASATLLSFAAIFSSLLFMLASKAYFLFLAALS